MHRVVVVIGIVYSQVHSVMLTILLYILAPSADGLRKILSVCEEFASSHRVCFNPAKTQIICFGTTVNCSCSDTFILCGQRLAMLSSTLG